MFDPTVKVIRYFKYRTAQIGGKDVLEFPRDYFREFEKHLAELAGVEVSNHSCYLVELNSPWNERQVRGILFSDSSMYLGTQVVEKSW